MINTLAELDKIRQDCRSLVTKRALASAAASLVPVPGLDAGADTLLLLEIIPKINKRFKLTEADVEALDPDSRKLLLKIVTTIGNAAIGASVTEKAVLAILKRVGVRVATASVVKYVPFIGTAIAGGLSFTAMRWVGNTHIDDCYAAARTLLGEAMPEKSASV